MEEMRKRLVDAIKDCNECPYWGRRYAPGSGGCSNQLVNDALELIKRLMEERK